MIDRQSLRCVFVAAVCYTALVSVSCQTLCSPEPQYSSRVRDKSQIAPIDADPWISGWRLLTEVATVTNRLVREACIVRLVKDENDGIDPARTALAQGTDEEREIGALVLFLKRTPEAHRWVAEYYVSRLADPHYVFRNIEGEKAWKLHKQWVLETVEKGTKRQHILFMRHVAPVVLELGRHAVPYLVPLLDNDQMEVRQNAAFLLEEITSLKIPFDVVSGADGGVADLLRKQGWLD